MMLADHSRCRELEHPDIANFSISVYVSSTTVSLATPAYPTAVQLHRAGYTRLVPSPALQDHFASFVSWPQSSFRTPRHRIWNGQHRQHLDAA